jgi:hypothetical protein
MVLATGLVGAGLWLRQQPTQREGVPQSLENKPPLSSTQQQRLQQQIQSLCQNPSLIEATLLARKNQFGRLHNNPSEHTAVLSDQDWLGALITQPVWAEQSSGEPEELPETGRGTAPKSANLEPLDLAPRPALTNHGLDSAIRAALDQQSQAMGRPADTNSYRPGDITYNRTTAGWRYLAVCFDLYGCRVNGWGMGSPWKPILC